ncbi:hypothetical protein C8Q80DRAFT_1153496 [Daedaleopsis nitida]|nr:hypothetical protein C8Q80DRAFT_1153496 [Daedaleopsis nitida]
MSSDSPPEHDDEQSAIHIDVPRRYYILPGAAVLTGITIGLFRGSRAASLRFLAENAHRTPKTVRGWYLYNKSKNYRVVLGGLKGAGADATKLGLTGVGWVALEEACTSLGLDDGREVAAGLGTGTLFGAVCECTLGWFLPCSIGGALMGLADADRLPWTAVRRTAVLGCMIGGLLRALRWSKEYLEEQVQTRSHQLAAASGEGRDGAGKTVGDATADVEGSRGDK